MDDRATEFAQQRAVFGVLRPGAIDVDRDTVDMGQLAPVDGGTDFSR